jgi:hypothetical protein
MLWVICQHRRLNVGTTVVRIPDDRVSLLANRFGYDQGVIASLLVMEDFQRQFPASPLQQGALSTRTPFSLVAYDL